VFYSNLFAQLQGHAPGFEIGAARDPGFRIVDFSAIKSAYGNHAGEHPFPQRGTIRRAQMATHLRFERQMIFFPQDAQRVGIGGAVFQGEQGGASLLGRARFRFSKRRFLFF
jgi:hypothetical protein